MLTLYLTCLIGGGIFVGLSVLSGLDDDVGFDADQGGGVDVDVDAEVELDGDALLADHASMADASHGLSDSPQRAAKRTWLPFMSFRFWTFGSAFFGLTGASLTLLSLSVEPIILALSSAVGVGVGTASAAIIRMLRKPVGQRRLRADDFTGATGELLLGLKAAGVSKVRLQGGGGVHELVAVSEDGGPIEKGAHVVVLGLDAEGRARVSRVDEIFNLEER